MGRNSREILLIGSNRELSEPLRDRLIEKKFEVSLAHRHDEGLARALHDSIAVVVTQLGDPHFSALQLLGEIHPAKPSLPVILVDKEVTADRAIEAARLGAYRYIAPPFSILDLFSLVVEAASIETGFMTLIESENSSGPAGLVGATPVMQELFSKIGIAAGSPATILIRGATGTGKELIARAIHQHSPRSAQRFVPVNCSAIPHGLMESELFGHEGGAFTGARGRQLGFFEEAQNATLFLDEIGDLEPSTQAKLLRALQERSIYRVGGRQEIHLDIKLIAATHRDLEALVKAGKFREDLLQRLSGFTITSPALTEHREDIWPLIKHFLIKHKHDLSLRSISIHRDAVHFLERLPWPGNVRELENTVCRAALLAGGRGIALAHVHQACMSSSQSAAGAVERIRGEPSTDLFDQAKAGELRKLRSHLMKQTDRSLFKKAFALAAGNQSKIALWLGISRKTVRGKLREFKFVLSDEDENDFPRGSNHSPR